ncbi:intracellular septation protein [Mariprofundus aestuarium]|uniref:Inner membrane-spanning protein YciB n=2 Tax=Mariprofundus aestuarium TaxID=1921086 RepID=A0A2K8KVG5_MARES|nr:intracellular septation protein [Mariprofundus aestuarium]
MKMFFDFLPVLLFFIVYKMYDIYLATGVLIAASFIQTVGHRVIKGSFEKTHVITFALIALFGGLTIALQDETFIKWKPTAINWLFSVVFIGSQFIGEKTIIERMMGGNLTLPRMVWLKLNIAWAIFFIVLGALNIYVAFSFDTDTWVNFKLFGLMGLTFLFIIAQSLFLVPYLKDSQADEND